MQSKLRTSEVYWCFSAPWVKQVNAKYYKSGSNSFTDSNVKYLDLLALLDISSKYKGIAGYEWLQGSLSSELDSKAHIQWAVGLFRWTCSCRSLKTTYYT